MKNQETQLWNYIDGLCTAEERKQVEILLAADSSFYALYQDLLNLNTVLHSDVDLEEPSTSFTRNVMEAAVQQAAPVSLQTKVSKAVVYAIAAVLTISLLALLVYAFGSANYSNNIKFSNFNTAVLAQVFLSSTALYAFLIFDAILLLAYLDSYLRRSLHRK